MVVALHILTLLSLLSLEPRYGQTILDTLADCVIAGGSACC
jgi:hypothetical protein